MAVISGVGVREYYRNRGYSLDNGYMKKNIDRYSFTSYRINDLYICLGILLLINMLFLYLNGNLQDMQYNQFRYRDDTYFMEF